MTQGPFHLSLFFFRDLAFFWRFGNSGFGLKGGRTDNETGLPPDPLFFEQKIANIL